MLDYKFVWGPLSTGEALSTETGPLAPCPWLRPPVLVAVQLCRVAHLLLRRDAPWFLTGGAGPSARKFRLCHHHLRT